MTKEHVQDLVNVIFTKFNTFSWNLSGQEPKLCSTPILQIDIIEDYKVLDKYLRSVIKKVREGPCGVNTYCFYEYEFRRHHYVLYHLIGKDHCTFVRTQ